ncbi:hypothetical protein ASPSYDRAFT_719523 [Aspergillus sydowii CBS 593.65]|uniref:Uncharacterized protein n=1 Tax=Aspergillus sydowii CBS 593.65 TaxID=1036612 RepID=A0A1L9SYE3_9EURO|nr:uncharacterized protein ASPSYDRAFT_719523 [Aspergillus sydowii CBS 593.65]OJJ52053.1 hypothetical protein ASPSYDRAFT_719523 [Aspergillus sydowii CBS 593.65]
MPIHTDEPSSIPDAAADDANFDPASTIHVSPFNASARPHISPSHSITNTANQLLNGIDTHNGQTPINTANMVYVDDMIQPILPARGSTPFSEQVNRNPGNMVIDDMLQPIPSMQDCDFTHQQTSNNINMVYVDDMIQPVLPARGFTPFSEQVNRNPGNMVIDDMLQPIPSMQDCDFTYQQTSNNINTGNVNMGNVTAQPMLPAQNTILLNTQIDGNSGNMVVDDMLQPVLPTYVGEPPEGQSQINMTNMVGVRDVSRPTLPRVCTLPDSQNNIIQRVGVHHVFRSTTPVQAPVQVDRQAPVVRGGLWPTVSQEIRNQNSVYGPQPVPAV